MNSFCICSKLNSIRSSVISSRSNNRNRKSVDSSSSFENQLSNANVEFNSSLKIYLKDNSKEIQENKNLMNFGSEKCCDKDVTLRTKREDDINLLDTMKRMSEMKFKWVKF